MSRRTPGDPDPLDHLRATPISVAAGWLGLEFRGDEIGPCPACGEGLRGRHERRLPIRFRGGHWKCFRCGEHGDVIALAAFALFQRRIVAGDPCWRELFAVFLMRGIAETRIPTAQPSLWAPPPDDGSCPPAAQVERLWNESVSVEEDGKVAAWLTARGISPRMVYERDLARALAPSAHLPVWAGTRQCSWLESGHRLIIPAFAADGTLASVHGRVVDPSERPGARKALFPTGFSSSNLIMANRLGRDVLEPAVAAGKRSSARVLIVEGLPDFLTWSTRLTAQGNNAWSVFGIWPGGWTPSFAGRIPQFSELVLRLHENPAGWAHADEIYNMFVDFDLHIVVAMAGRVAP